MAPQSMITPATVLMVIPVSIAIPLLVNIKINNALYHRQRDNKREREREVSASFTNLKIAFLEMFDFLQLN